MYYHELTVWTTRGQQRRIIPSNASNIDEAYRERCQIEKRYHPSAIVESTTCGQQTGENQ